MVDSCGSREAISGHFSIGNIRIQKKQILSICLGFAVLALWLLMNRHMFARLASISTLARQLLYLAILASSFLATTGWAVCGPRLAVAGLSLLLFNSLVAGSFFACMGRALTLLDAQTLYESMGNIGDALGQYRGAIGLTLLESVALVAALAWLRHRVRYRSRVPFLAGWLAAALMFAGALARGGDTAVVGFPNSVSAVLFTGAVGANVAVRRWACKRQGAPVLRPVAANGAVRHLVLVIDESIEGRAFRDLPGGIACPDSRNLGLGYSYGNGSATSNYFLRRAADPLDASATAQQFPSLFQLAREAGFTTCYLDCQGVLNDHAVQDYFDAHERGFIDRVVPAADFGSPRDRDLDAAARLLGILREPGRTFTIVQKQGTHFPYRECLPPELQGAADPYRASITRTSRDFLARLAPGLTPGTLVFYTSDHGQNFHGAASHGNLPPECAVSEWTVPVIILYGPDLARLAKGIDPAWQDRATHAALAEAIRNLLGRRNPGQASLWAPPPAGELDRSRGFYGTPMGLFGKPASFVVIDKVAQRILEPTAGGAVAVKP
jgi:glucan phosphoethanolaminetransferase (alkaline phosphatase superfamily)